MAKVYLAQLGTFKNGLNFSAEKVGSGCKIIGIPDFGDRYIADINELKEIDNSIVSEEYLLRNGDILFVRSNGNKALVGRTMLIQNISEDVTFSGFCIRFRPDHKKVSSLYLLYLFKSPFFRRYFSNTQQTSINNLNQEVLGGMEIDLPKRDEQEKLIKGVHAFTKKINNNLAINDKLQHMAYETYMHLFWNRNPNGKLGDILIEKPKSSIQVGAAKNAIGEFPFFTSGDAILRWTEALVEGRNCYLNTGGNAGVKHYVGNAAYSTDTWCITAKNDLSDYLYLFLESIKPELNKKFFQGTGLKHLQKPLLKERPIYIPSKNEVKAFNKDVQPWLSMISENMRESQQLIMLREWLLPMIMNGQAVMTD